MEVISRASRDVSMTIFNFTDLAHERKLKYMIEIGMLPRIDLTNSSFITWRRCRACCFVPCSVLFGDEGYYDIEEYDTVCGDCMKKLVDQGMLGFIVEGRGRKSVFCMTCLFWMESCTCPYFPGPRYDIYTNTEERSNTIDFVLTRLDLTLPFSESFYLSIFDNDFVSNRKAKCDMMRLTHDISRSFDSAPEIKRQWIDTLVRLICRNGNIYDDKIKSMVATCVYATSSVRAIYPQLDLGRKTLATLRSFIL